MEQGRSRYSPDIGNEMDDGATPICAPSHASYVSLWTEQPVNASASASVCTIRRE